MDGRPVPLNRHRTGRGFIYNPSARPQSSLAAAVAEGMRAACGWENVYEETDGGCGLRPVTLLGGDLLELDIVFRMRRPSSHYVSNKVGEGRLKEGWDHDDERVTGGRVDIDNLVKFFMDSLNGVAYDDDRQVVAVKAAKVYDVRGLGEGGIDFRLRKVQGTDLLALADSFFEEEERGYEAE